MEVGCVKGKIEHQFGTVSYRLSFRNTSNEFYVLPPILCYKKEVGEVVKFSVFQSVVTMFASLRTLSTILLSFSPCLYARKWRDTGGSIALEEAWTVPALSGQLS